MAGEASDRSPVTAEECAERLHLARRIEMVKLAVGVPALLLSLFGTVLAFRLRHRSLADPVFWFTLAGVLAVFAAYFGHIAWTLRRLRRSGKPC
ncbi:MAG: hypothetical protein HY900_17985 [Deltaproteobacteria bacterium]|nr:hypothetical protein [Deltaproteobacteria bacterium]